MNGLFSLTQEQLEDAAGTHVKNAVLAALPSITTIALDFVAKQFGLGRIKKLFRDKVKDLPATIETKLKTWLDAKVAAIRQAVVGSVENPYAGQVGKRYTFHYRDKEYKLIVARLTNQGQGASPYVVKIIPTDGDVIILTAKQITENSALDATNQALMLQAYQSVLAAAGQLETGLTDSRRLAQEKRKARRKGKSGVTGTNPPPANPPKVKLAELAANLRSAVGTESTASSPSTGLLKYLSQYGCSMLNAGCFAAGTKLWTPLGYQNVEDLREGDRVYARNEFDPTGPIDAKPIEQVFRRFTEIVHLHLGGQLLRTTQEHPFYVFDQGWTPVSDLKQGDWLLTATGDWQSVDEVYYTGELEVVYNLRVADHHTYFVGDDNWGWALWAHNTYQTFVDAAYAARPNRLNIKAEAGTLYDKFMKDFNAGNGTYSRTQLIKDLRKLTISPSDAKTIAEIAYQDYLLRFESERHALPRDVDMIHDPQKAWHAWNFPIQLLINRALATNSPEQSRWLTPTGATNTAVKWDVNYADAAGAHSVPIDAGEGEVITVAPDGTYIATPATRAIVIRYPVDDYIYIHTFPILPTHHLFNQGP